MNWNPERPSGGVRVHHLQGCKSLEVSPPRPAPHPQGRGRAPDSDPLAPVPDGALRGRGQACVPALPFPGGGRCGCPRARRGGLTRFSWLGMMQRTKLGVVLRSVVMSFPSCSLYSCPTVRNMPFLVLEALGSELSVILAIWSSPTMRSTAGHIRGGVSRWPPPQGARPRGGGPPRPPAFPLPPVGEGRCRGRRGGLLSRYYLLGKS